MVGEEKLENPNIFFSKVVLFFRNDLDFRGLIISDAPVMVD